MVGEVIRSLRGSAGLSQQQLADLVKISPSSLSLIESGRREPTVRLMRDLARALEIPVAALLVVALTDTGEDEVPLAPREAEKLKALAESLLMAAQHAIVLRRLQTAREQRSA